MEEEPMQKSLSSINCVTQVPHGYKAPHHFSRTSGLHVIPEQFRHKRVQLKQAPSLFCKCCNRAQNHVSPSR
eukprot:1366120-Amphidinium_carterae.1